MRYHAAMPIRPQTRFGPLTLGLAPKVVGTISRRETLAHPAAFPCDIVEVRLDLLGADTPGWTDQIRNIALPVIVTIRLTNEGGKWAQPDEARLPLFEAALQHATAVDIEYRSPLMKQVSELACRHQRALIISYHDFERTPPLAELQQVIRTGANYGTVVKIATLTNTEDDVATLRGLFAEQCSASVCLLGMGPLGPRTRVEFPRLGSCFTYGYLDAPIAPGQVAASQLKEALQ
ncbi:MAG: type I 3-dehydroquinate dehydratase [Verrucomicrobia bacterium]|nr:type I 3-dehydroquinate dehydratase [Verrucomicrobiota bacterium]